MTERLAMPPESLDLSHPVSLKLRLRLWRTRGRSRIALPRLDARLLRDCGLTECDVRQEMQRPFWYGWPRP